MLHGNPPGNLCQDQQLSICPPFPWGVNRALQRTEVAQNELDLLFEQVCCKLGHWLSVSESEVEPQQSN